MKLNFNRIKYFLIGFYVLLFLYILSKHNDPDSPHNVASPRLHTLTPLEFESDLDKDIFLWTNIYKYVEDSFTYKNLDVDNYFNSNFELPDYKTDIFAVPTRKRYCWANFLHYMLNPLDLLLKENFLFTDYKPSNSLKHELSKLYKLANERFYDAEFTRKRLESRKKAEWNPHIRMYFTNSTLHYNMVIGKNYLCPFQSANQVPGQGALSRPDLLADMMSMKNLKLKVNARKKASIKKCLGVEKFYPETFRLYKKTECSEFFKKSEEKSYQKEMKQKPVYIRKQTYRKHLQKIDFQEDHKLKKFYRNGEECGHKRLKEVIQKSVPRQLTYEERRKFKIRAFVHFASFDPLIVYYSPGYVLLERYDKKESFMSLMVSLDELGEFFYKNQIIDSVSGFIEDINLKSKELIRKIVYLSQNKFLKDGRLFQVFGVDLMLDKDMNLWLADIKINPVYSLKGLKFVENVLSRQYAILNHRSAKQYELFKMIKSEVDEYVSQNILELKYAEPFDKQLRSSINFEEKNKALSNILKELPENIDQDGLIFDERAGIGFEEEDKKVYHQFLREMEITC